MKRKKIYQVFNTAFDAYWEYRMHYLARESFADAFELDELEVDRLLSAAKDVEYNGLTYFTIDYYFQMANNRKYIHKEIHW